MPRLMRFAIISDTHFVYPSDGTDGTLWNRQIFSRTEELANTIVDALNVSNVDFVVHCGDLTHHGDLSSLEFAADTFRRLNAPFYAALGNHDVAVSGARDFIANKLGRLSSEFFYHEYINGVRFIFLDSNYAHLKDESESEVMEWRKSGSYRGVGFSARELLYIEEELNRDKASTTFVVVRHPIASKPEYPRISPRSLGSAERRLAPVDRALFPHLGDAVVELLDKHSNVKAVFSGHWHINDIVLRAKTHYIQTASLVEYPLEYRIVEVSDEFMDISTHSLPGDHLRQQSLVPEWHNTWLTGELFDRNRRIYFNELPDEHF